MSKPAKHSHLHLVVNLALIALAFALLGGVIWNHRARIRQVLAHGLDARLFALAFVAYMAALVLTFVRWTMLVKVIDRTFRFREAALLGFIGNVYNLVIPGAVGGDLIKAAYLAKMRINTTQGIASMIIDRILGMLGLFVLAGVAGIVAWPMSGVVLHRLTVIVWTCVAIGLIGLYAVFAQALTRRYPQLLEGPGRIALILKELKALSEIYHGRLDVVVGALALSAISHSLNVFAFFKIGEMMFGTAVPSLAKHFLMVPLILFTTAVPLPFGALGLTENVSEQLFKFAAHPDGALAMMGFRVIMYAGALVSVCIYLANIRQVRGLTDTAKHLEEDLLEDVHERS
jgi:uncharacterized protein (TIRG00374 family)